MDGKDDGQIDIDRKTKERKEEKTG
jgi:hypothetical protein